MKIIKESENVMVLKDRNIIFYILGVIFILIGGLVILEPHFFNNQPPIWIGFVGIFVGGFVIANLKIITVNLDKSVNKITFLQRGLIKKSCNAYDLNQIKEVELSVAYHNSRRGGGYSYHLAFVCNNGEVIQLNPGSISIFRIMGRQLIPEKILGARIARFLSVSFQERRPPTINEALSAITSAIQDASEKEIKNQNKS